MELRGETALMRDRHARHYADLAAELDLLVRGAQQIEGETRMSAEWDNLRAAHLWSLAQGDLELAERLAEGSFQFAAFSMRHEHAAMLERTVRLGDELRPAVDAPCSACSATGATCRATRKTLDALAQRGLDVAPATRASRHGELLVRVPGASAAVAAGSPEAVAAFRHQSARRLTADLDLDWFALVCLTDASLNCDPSGHTCVAATAQGHRRPGAVPSTDDVRSSIRGPCPPPRDVAAGLRRERFTRTNNSPRIAHATGDVHNLGIALRCLAMAATGLGAPDALARCHDALDDLVRDSPLAEDLADPRISLARLGNGGAHRTRRRDPRPSRRALVRVWDRARPSLPRACTRARRCQPSPQPGQARRRRDVVGGTSRNGLGLLRGRLHCRLRPLRSASSTDRRSARPVARERDALPASSTPCERPSRSWSSNRLHPPPCVTAFDDDVVSGTLRVRVDPRGPGAALSESVRTM